MSSFWSSLFRKKLPGQADETSRLEPCLGAWDLTLFGVGAIIGTGIFVLTGVAAATQAGPAVVLSFIVSGLACAFAALCYAELSASVGGCGSAYGYSYAAFGELIAWMIGWDLILEYGVAVAAVANGWSGYFNNALTAIGFGLPDMLIKGPAAGGIVNLPAVGIVLILMGLLCAGVKESARLNAAMVFVKLLAIAVFVAVAAFNIKPELWSPFMPFGWFEKTPDGHTVGVLAGASLVFCTLIYIIVSGLLTGVVHYSELNVPSPVAHALQLLGINWASALVATGVITGLTTVMLVIYYGLTRIIFALSRDGLMSPFFSKVHPKRHTPVRTTVLCGLVIAITAGFLPFTLLAELVNIGTLAAFVLVCAGVIVLRIQRPDMPRPFRMPFGLTLPIMGVLSCGALICFLPLMTQLRFVVWLAVGVVIYFLYSWRHSKLAPKAL